MINCPHCGKLQDDNNVYIACDNDEYYGKTDMYCDYCDKLIVFNFCWELKIEEIRKGK